MATRQDDSNSSGSQGDETRPSRTYLKAAAAVAAGGAMALGAKAIHSYRNRQGSPSSSRSSSPERDGGKGIGKKVAIGAGVGALALGAGVAGTAAYVNHKRSERRSRNVDRGPFIAKLVGRRYGKLDTHDPFGLMRKDDDDLVPDNGDGQDAYYESSHQQSWSTFEAGAGVATSAFLHRQEEYDYVQSHHGHHQPPQYYVPDDAFSASPSAQFLGQVSRSSPLDPFGNNLSSSNVEATMSRVDAGEYTCGTFGAGDCGRENPTSAATLYFNRSDTSHRVQASVSMCDDIDVQSTYRLGRVDSVSGVSYAEFFSLGARSSADDCGCGCGGHKAEKLMDVFAAANNNPAWGGPRCVITCST